MLQCSTSPPMKICLKQNIYSEKPIKMFEKFALDYYILSNLKLKLGYFFKFCGLLRISMRTFLCLFLSKYFLVLNKIQLNPTLVPTKYLLQKTPVSLQYTIYNSITFTFTFADAFYSFLPSLLF